LLQEGKDDIDLPNCYFTWTFDKDQQKLSTIEKKLLALLLSFKHFDVHVIHSWCLQITTPSHLLKNAKQKSQINDMGINIARIQSDYETY
jgi:hypothetical protein